MPSLSDLPDILKVVKGSSQTWDIYLFGNDDLAEDLSGVTRVLATVKEYAGSSTSLLTLDSDLASIAINTGYLTLTPGSVTLDPGTYLIDFAFYDGSDWYVSTPIELLVSQPMTELR